MARGSYIDQTTRAAIIAHMACNGGNKSDTARAFNISARSVDRIMKSSEPLVEVARAKHEIAERTMDEYMQQAASRAQEFVSKALDALCDEEKISNASLQQIATAMGIVIDKWQRAKQEETQQAGGVIVMPPVQEPAKDDEVVWLDGSGQ